MKADAAPAESAVHETGMRPFSASLPMALLRARESLMRRFRPGLRAAGVTEQQWRILRVLADQGPLEITELARATLLLAPSLSRILPEMEARGLLRRTQLEADLRRTSVSILPRGLQLIARHAAFSEAIYLELQARFGRPKLEQLLALLREIDSCAAEGPMRGVRRRT